MLECRMLLDKLKTEPPSTREEFVGAAHLIQAVALVEITEVLTHLREDKWED